MSFKVPSELYFHNYIPGQSLWLLQEWIGWRARYEELFWSLFFLQVIPSIISAVTHLISMYSYVRTGFAMGTLFFVIILVVTIGKPYRKVYMNLLDTLILSNIMILSYALSSGFRNPIIAQTLIAMPITVFVVAIILKIMYMCRLHIMCHKLKLLYSLSRCNTTSETNKNTIVNTSTSSQPLLQPTSTVFSYGTNNYNS